MRKRILTGSVSVLLLLLLNTSVHAGSCAIPESGSGAGAVSVPEAAQWYKAGSGLFGANALFNNEDDDFWASPGTIPSLRAAHITTLRFPGGELADRYDWETNSLDSGDTTDAALHPGHETDYLEFLARARQTGENELFFVVNVDGAFRASGDLNRNLARYAAKAAAWVKAVKAAGYHVRFWEIGNEPYIGAGFALTADEYAKALNVYARAMRAADPSIRIGAAGPGVAQGVAYADRIGPSALSELRRNGGGTKRACRGTEREACLAAIETDAKRAKGKQAWWPTMVEKAAHSFDFAIVHRYAIAKTGTGRFALTMKIRNLGNYLDKATGRTVPIALTEWNTPNERKNNPLTEMEQLANIAVQLGNNAVAGVDYAHYWPMRSHSGAHKSLLDEQSRLTKVGQLYAAAGALMTGSDVAESMPARNVYLLRMRHKDGAGLLAVNESAADVRLRIANPGGSRMSQRIFSGDARGTALAPAECEASAGSSADIMVPAGGVVVVKVMK